MTQSTETNPSEPEIGPQHPGDTPFRAQMRLQQSRYRAQVLGVPYGAGPRPTSKTLYGNMLTPADGERGLNFLTRHIFEVAKRRLAENRGSLDAFRLKCDLLSDRALGFNLFAPLVDDRELALRLAQALISEEVATVTRVALAYSPEPAREYLNDRTAFDAFIDYKLKSGERGFLGVETRLAGESEAKPFASPRYRELTAQPGAPWHAGALEQLLQPEINPIWREHLLAEALLRHPRARYAHGRFLTLFHPQDEARIHALAGYQELLAPGQGTAFEAQPLDGALGAWERAAETGSERTWVEGLRARYL